jgi:hypothetical protein
MLRRAVIGLYRRLFPPEERYGPVPPYFRLDSTIGIRLLAEARTSYRQKP